MSKYPFFLRSISLPLATLLAMALTMTGPIPLLGREAARLDGFTQADGSNVFALTLKPALPAAQGPRDVVVLFSTAASHTGEYRAKSLATLQSMLAKLGEDDRVQLVAFDLDATSLTQGFAAPNSPQMAAAIETLRRRTPLGACDLEKALQTAVKSYAMGGKAARAIVYIGDGSSRANVLTTDQLDRVVNDLVARHAPLIALAVGPQFQEQMLGTLAARTGGLVVLEQWDVAPAAYGTRLAQAVHGSVLWPTAADNVKWPAGLDVYPKTFPPLRSDRDTVLVGTAKSIAASQVAIGVEGLAGPQRLAWDIPELKSEARNAYLVTLLAQAKSDGGRTLPLVDSASLATARQEIEAGGHGLAWFADEALRGGNPEGADRLAGEALRRNPRDTAARAVRDAVAKMARGAPLPAAGAKVASPQAGQIPPVTAAGDLNLQGENGGAPPPDGAAAAQEINRVNALEEQWRMDVHNAIDKACNQVTFDPTKAAATIQRETSDLTAESGLRPETRDRLLGALRTARLEIQGRAEAFTHQEQQRIREEAARREMEMTNAGLQRQQDKLKQVMERYDWLMDEGRRRLAEEQAASEAEKIAEGGCLAAKPATIVAAHVARICGAYDDMAAIRAARQKGFVDTLFQVERSQVPIPDAPPIVYPDAEFWKEITARRKEQFAAMDLSRRSPAEKKIDEALKQPTQIEFVETPLKDVVDYLKDLHGIEIQLDAAALKEASIEDSTPVTKNLKGVSLRSALKLLLGDLNLTYVVHDEVLFITTPEKAQSGEYLTTKVYPVAELVLPIKAAPFTGGFGNLGNNSMNGSNMQSNGSMPCNGNPFGNMQGNGNPFGNGNMQGNGNGNPFGNGNMQGNGLF